MSDIIKDTHTDSYTSIRKDYLGNGLHIRRSQDVGDVLNANKELQVHGQAKDLRFGRKFAAVPQIVLEQWAKEGIDYRKINKCEKTKRAFMAKLDSNEFRAFRTHTGRL